MLRRADPKNIVHSRAYRLLKPREVAETVLEHPVRDRDVVVEPSLGSICHADLRYYTGQRRPEALEKKLPMALIHEGVGNIVSAAIPELPVGQRVVIVPNIPGYVHQGIDPQRCCPACRTGIGDNYCRAGRFLGSGTDGIAQSRVVVPAPCVVPIPDDIPDEIAALTELCSVSYQALLPEAGTLADAQVAVFGDGPVGYLAAAMLRYVFGVGRDRLQVFGADPSKLAQFDFANRTLVQEYDFRSGEAFDLAVECTGGRFSKSAVNQAIDALRPGGRLILMGVTEERVPVNTRDVLEKGLTLRGSSRSSASDFPPVLQAMRSPACQEALRKLLPSERTRIDSAADFVRAMEQAALHKEWKKALLEFHW